MNPETLSKLKELADTFNVDEVRTALKDAGVDTKLIESGMSFLVDNPLVVAPIAQIGLLIGITSIMQAKSASDVNSYGDSSSAYVERARSEIYASNGRYNPIDAEIYYSARPLQFIARSAEIFAVSAAFGLKLSLDLAQDKLFDYDTELQRADELCDILTNLGPAFIKIGQSLSVRADLLRPAYVIGLTKLQDRVPPFPTEQALSIVAQELGLSSAQRVFTDLKPSSVPVAAASLGQVFKANMRRPHPSGDGTTENVNVAVKVQRPDILSSVSLDLHIIRSIAPVLKKVAGLESDVLSIIDSLGEGFVDELDYRREADNAALFMNVIQQTPLRGVVFAPEVVPEATSRRVLTTLWVDGTRLEESPKEEVSKLCSIAMNTYLTMMLQAPLLHADPHPGNLKRTPEGKLCIMDWGLVTAVAPDLQETYIEHIAHLVSRDYDEVPGDLVKLGFVGEGMEALAQEKGVVDTLASIYGEWAMGGGAAKVDVAGVVTRLNSLTQEYGNFFRLPPYFAYIARAFGVLEGIGLQADPDYAIVSECLPYIAQRLLTTSAASNGGGSGSSARSVAALESFLYGKEKRSKDRVIDAERITLLLDGFSSYRSVSNEAATRTTVMMNGHDHNNRRSSGHSDNHYNNDRGGGSAEEDDYSLFASGRRGRDAGTIQPLVMAEQQGAKGRRSSERVRKVEEAADLVVALLIEGDGDDAAAYTGAIGASSGEMGQHSSLQSLMLEEAAKLLGALSRQQWARLRARSGRTPDGSRSALGAVVDPLGIFSKGRLVNMDAADDRVLQSASAIVSALRDSQSALPSSLSGGEEESLSPLRAAQEGLRSLSADEAREIAGIISQRLWSRRRDLARVGGRLGRVLLKQARQRL
jgi:predicted unusual protein kinase regulating ubiquinone biosynthesis (AarF/ABC1/UbiB family)